MGTVLKKKLKETNPLKNVQAKVTNRLKNVQAKKFKASIQDIQETSTTIVSQTAANKTSPSKQPHPRGRNNNWPAGKNRLKR